MCTSHVKIHSSVKKIPGGGFGWGFIWILYREAAFKRYQICFDQNLFRVQLDLSILLPDYSRQYVY